MSRFSNCFGMVLIIFCCVQLIHALFRKGDQFMVKYEWSYINYTWPSQDAYEDALNTKNYIPENNGIAGLKFYKENMYVAIPRFKAGIPVTLAYMSTLTNLSKNNLLIPYPSWEMNEQDCNTLQNVQSMEIDTNGIMWVLDGTRINTFTNCPPKLVLMDLNNEGKVINSYTFPDHICLTNGGFLNDLVVDEIDGGYAYITDNSYIDPGLIIYSRSQNDAWKLRDKSMFAEVEAANFRVNDTKISNLIPIDGIALSPIPKNETKSRKIYYSALTAYNIYSITTDIVKNRDIVGEWRKHVKFEGKKNSQSDGLIIDNQGYMYFGLLGSSKIGKWNIHKSFRTARAVYYNRKELIWPDSFAMDSNGNLYCLASAMYKYSEPTYETTLSNDTNIRIFSLHTGNKNYMY